MPSERSNDLTKVRMRRMPVIVGRRAYFPPFTLYTSSYVVWVIILNGLPSALRIHFS